MGTLGIDSLVVVVVVIVVVVVVVSDAYESVCMCTTPQTCM